ncbi:[protein-PII] uridylyltransferase [Desulfurispirillum indicum]|uniref:Bifunctional uridylyltransferase/uridylyl-removing enzyme n=1 Tax=Desulfurispirillum indicum (strain ATCC BAA-1389 / DSM 22839 / S5) TaxID=653733 RepID=E6W2K7_DESIS|nr:[protein-PII] uridylyltransferase [Desulfurispirillum indicum]ADU65591.1 protein-P-II uridylyltransferase [Desulfurispirillum indicum S5]UCZ57577.1 [protein-PII] uridylyltransferase [Desulfurispirillum indicum]
MMYRIHADLRNRLDFLLENRLRKLNQDPNYCGASLPNQELMRRSAVVEIFRKFYHFSFHQMRTLHDSGVSADYTVTFHTVLVDVCVQKMWEVVERECERRADGCNVPAIIAVGGYGRGELNPFSDIDLLIVSTHAIDSTVDTLANNLLYMSWDVGLKISHSVRSIDECLQWMSDITVKTALLEARFICGSSAAWEQFDGQVLYRIFHRQTDSFIYQKINEQKQRLEKQSSSLYLLEPNVKEGVGGLRDIHTCVWIARVRYGGMSMAHLEEKLEFGDLKKAREFLWRVRNELHFIANRSQDILTFENQQQISRKFGYRDERSRKRLAVELFMHDYYKCTRRIQAATEQIIYRCTPQKFRRKIFGELLVRALPDGFIQKGNEIAIPARDDFFREDPLRILKLFSLAQRKSLHIPPDAKQTIQKNLGFLTPKLRSSLSANGIFRSILKYTANVSRTLRQMHQCGVLGKWLPEFGTLDCLVQFDRYHVYTTDKHTLKAVEFMELLYQQGCLGNKEIFCRAIAHARKRDLLYMAILLHDVGKGKGGDHSNKGAILAGPVCQRMGFSEAETELIQFLIRHHVLMANISQRRDIADPRTVEIFCGEVDSMEKLANLYLLTCCDIRAVGPKVWTDWKGQLLESLFEAAEHYLRTGQTEKYNVQAVRRMRQHLLEKGVDPFTLQLFDDEYLLLFNDEDILLHSRLIARLRDSAQPLLVSHRVSPETQTADIFITGYDLPGIFSNIAGAILVNELEIISCRVQTFQNGMIFDVFTVYYRDSMLGASVSYWKEVIGYIQNVLLGKRQLELSRSWTRRKTLKKDFSRVFVHNDQSEKYTVVEVFTRDKPGLLYDLTRLLYTLGLTIHSASITTNVEQVVDVFYVSDLKGNKVLSEERIEGIKEQVGGLL